MNRPYTLYLDETGNRHPDKRPDVSRQGRDWFAFGGVLIRGEDNDTARQHVHDFHARWKLTSPCHLTDINAEKKGFAWLGKVDQARRDQFRMDWRRTLCAAPVVGVGCVVDRPGYIARGYLERYNDKWLLCRSAFDITVERCVKIAKSESRKLNIVFESDPSMNKTVVAYFHNLKNNGLNFDIKNSSKYNPLTLEDFQSTLGRIDYKPKEHPLLQLADSYIYAIARNGYDKKFDLYRHLRDHRRIADFAFPGRGHEVGIKYYCFDK